ncbi:unnamed protein product, partial [Brassica napus]
NTEPVFNLGFLEWVRIPCVSLCYDRFSSRTIFFNAFDSSSLMVGQASSGTWMSSRYLEDPFFTPAKVVDKRSRFYRLLHRMLLWVHKRQRFGGVKNLLVIAKALPGQDNITMINERLLHKDTHYSWNQTFKLKIHIILGIKSHPRRSQGVLQRIEDTLSLDIALCYGRESIDLSSAYPTDDDDDDSGSSSQGVKRASETDAAGSAKKRLQKEADSQN